MTTHKDRPHTAECALENECESCGSIGVCDCGGTRSYGYGATVQDAIAIQGIATFFARLQPAVAYAYKFRLAGEHDDFEDITLRRHRAISADAVFGMRGHDFANDAHTSEIELYASPVMPAAQPVEEFHPSQIPDSEGFCCESDGSVTVWRDGRVSKFWPDDIAFCDWSGNGNNLSKPVYGGNGGAE